VLSVGLGLAPSKTGGLSVSFVVDGGAAARAGVREGDELVAVNGAPVKRGATPG
jgi:S1-C subfamily serine protease